jgi:hypothetical protein
VTAPPPDEHHPAHRSPRPDEPGTATHPPRREGPAWLRAENPFSLAVRTIDSFRPASMPAMARHSYRRELLAAAFLPWLVAIVEGGVIGVIVKKSFDGVVGDTPLNYAVALLTAAPAFANITSFVWVRLTHGKHKIRSVNALQIVVATLICLLAVAPRSPIGLVMVLACAVGARVCLAGVVTLRATVWRLNYAKPVRARMTSRITVVVTIVLASVGGLVGLAMDRDPDSFRLLAPVSAVLASVGIWSWSKIRVRGHKRLLREEMESEGDGRPSFNPLRMLDLLLTDRRYGFFMLCQFLIGVGNLMLIPVLVVVVKDVFDLDYFRSILVTHMIPILVMPLIVTQWAKLLDAWHIATYRALHSWLFVIMAGLMFASVRTDAIWLLYAAVVVRGVAFAGGALAWNLGHNDFAQDPLAPRVAPEHGHLLAVGLDPRERGPHAVVLDVPLSRRRRRCRSSSPARSGACRGG